jgi:hypothetical protein
LVVDWLLLLVVVVGCWLLVVGWLVVGFWLIVDGRMKLKIKISKIVKSQKLLNLKNC